LATPDRAPRLLGLDAVKAWSGRPQRIGQGGQWLWAAFTQDSVSTTIRGGVPPV